MLNELNLNLYFYLWRFYMATLTNESLSSVEKSILFSFFSLPAYLVHLVSSLRPPNPPQFFCLHTHCFLLFACLRGRSYESCNICVKVSERIEAWCWRSLSSLTSLTSLTSVTSVTLLTSLTSLTSRISLTCGIG
eukprot:GHVN01053642.1.p1 GENE.GHVN01053642.1~~GHVN01053642.1.p1  ORF type:complete len:135 (-),score=32.99 GHVN01053642.1:203-607(-)